VQSNPPATAAKPTRDQANLPATAGGPLLRQRRGPPGSSTINASVHSRLTVPRKFFRKYLPDAEAVRSRRLVAVFGRRLQHPNLWHLNRRSVPGAIAIGLFAGLVPGPLQILTALLLAVPLKKNIPVAFVTTFYTNPLTIVPLYLLAYQYGALILGLDRSAAAVTPFEMDWSDWFGSMLGMLDWTLALGKPLALGLVALALTLAAVGYFAVRIGWRVHVTMAWRSRSRRRKMR
jgi:uncharacterized protein